MITDNMVQEALAKIDALSAEEFEADCARFVYVDEVSY